MKLKILQQNNDVLTLEENYSYIQLFGVLLIIIAILAIYYFGAHIDILIFSILLFGLLVICIASFYVGIKSTYIFDKTTGKIQIFRKNIIRNIHKTYDIDQLTQISLLSVRNLANAPVPLSKILTTNVYHLYSQTLQLVFLNGKKETLNTLAKNAGTITFNNFTGKITNNIDKYYVDLGQTIGDFLGIPFKNNVTKL